MSRGKGWCCEGGEGDGAPVEVAITAAGGRRLRTAEVDSAARVAAEAEPPFRRFLPGRRARSGGGRVLTPLVGRGNAAMAVFWRRGRVSGARPAENSQAGLPLRVQRQQAFL